MAEKIRCSECGNIIAYENEPINDKGEISIMCNNRKPNGKRCKTVNIIKSNNIAKKMKSPLDVLIDVYIETMKEKRIDVSQMTREEMLRNIEKILLTPNN